MFNQKGQSTIEYILLLVVVVALGTGLMNSATFKKFVGEDSELMEKLVKQMKYAYRHGRMGTVDDSNYSKEHETYYNKDEGRSRFFTSKTKYPP